MLEHDWYPRAIPDNVIIGERTWCYSAFAFLHYASVMPCGLRIGNDTGIYNGTFFDFGPKCEVEIGNFCTLVGAIISSNGRVSIGDYTLIAHNVILADSFAGTPHDSAIIDASESRIDIGANCWIGARAVLLSGCKLGEGSIVGAAAVVDFEVPPNSIVAGNPARIVGCIK